jgi:hypothetical protein
MLQLLYHFRQFPGIRNSCWQVPGQKRSWKQRINRVSDPHLARLPDSRIPVSKIVQLATRSALRTPDSIITLRRSIPQHHMHAMSCHVRSPVVYAAAVFATLACSTGLTGVDEAADDDEDDEEAEEDEADDCGTETVILISLLEGADDDDEDEDEDEEAQDAEEEDEAEAGEGEGVGKLGKSGTSSPSSIASAFTTFALGFFSSLDFDFFFSLAFFSFAFSFSLSFFGFSFFFSSLSFFSFFGFLVAGSFPSFFAFAFGLLFFSVSSSSSSCNPPRVQRKNT